MKESFLVYLSYYLLVLALKIFKIVFFVVFRLARVYCSGRGKYLRVEIFLHDADFCLGSTR